MPLRFKFSLVFLLSLISLFPGLSYSRTQGPVLAYTNPWPAADEYPYFGRSVPLSWVDITSGGTPLSFVGEDSYLGPFPIGFDFPFYNQTYGNIYINANGFLTFEPKAPELDVSMYAVNQCPLPNADKPNNIIAMLWGDLEPKDERGPYLYYRSFPSCPVGSGRCLVVSFIDWRFALSHDAAGTFQAILYQNGDIVLQYMTVGGSVGATSTNSFTVGIENADAGLGYGLTYLCDVANKLTGGTAVKYVRNFLTLSPEKAEVKSCNGQTTYFNYAITNSTGAAGDFTVTCSTDVPGFSLQCPATVAVANKDTASFTATLSPPPCTTPGLQVNGTVTVSGNNYSSISTLTQTVYHNAIWDQIPPEPEYCRQDIVAGTYGDKIWAIAGKGDSQVRTYDPTTRLWTVESVNFADSLELDNYARSGCQHGSKIFFYGDGVTEIKDGATDTKIFTGLWSFDMATRTVQRESNGGPPTGGVFGPAWVYDPQTELCYLTGGGDSPDPPNQNTKNTVYVYDPKNNSWPLNLSPFTTPRKLHAAFIFERPSDNHRLLCLAGGVYTYYPLDTPLSSTQCYDLTAGNALRGENADLGPLPSTWWGMGYTQRLLAGNQQELWLVGGVLPNNLVSDKTLYYDATAGAWKAGGNLPSGPAYRSSAVTSNGVEIFKLGGLFELSQVCSADHFKRCLTCGWWTNQLFLPLVLK